MSYTPTLWENGDLISPEKLNKIEQAIKEIITEPFIVTLTPTNPDLSGTMDKTPSEIFAAVDAGRRVRMVIPSLEVGFDVTQYGYTEGNIVVAGNVTYDFDGVWRLITIITDSENPVYSTHIFYLDLVEA